MAPPPFLQIFQEQIKPGRAGLHPSIESGWPRAFGRAKIKNHYIGMATTYGEPEAWFCSGIQSIAQIEEQNQAIEKAPGLSRELERLSQADAVNLTGYRAVLARYESNLSNPANIDPVNARVWEILIFNVRPGMETNFMEAARMYRTMVESAKIELPWATYSVMSGMPGPTFLVFIPHKSLTEIDPNTGPMAALEKSINPDQMKRINTLAQGYTSVESRIFTVSPEMSYPPPEWATQNPELWGRKRPTASTGTPPASGS
jgi:hypothetical protein